MIIRRAEAKDVVLGAEFILEGDDGLCIKKVDEVLRPNDEWKAFSADDGCRYGLDGLWVIEKSPKKNVFNIVPVIMGFSHEITADKIIFMRTVNPARTLLGQLEDKINDEINKQVK
jgi:hypothetical protein